MNNREDGVIWWLSRRSLRMKILIWSGLNYLRALLSHPVIIAPSIEGYQLVHTQTFVHPNSLVISCVVMRICSHLGTKFVHLLGWAIQWEVSYLNSVKYGPNLGVSASMHGDKLGVYAGVCKRWEWNEKFCLVMLKYTGWQLRWCCSDFAVIDCSLCYSWS